MKRLTFFLTVVIILLSGEIFSQFTQLPTSMQAIMFKKIFTYVRSLKEQENIRVLIVYDEKTIQEKDALFRAFLNENVNVMACTVENLASCIKDASVVYLTTGISNNEIKKLCINNRVLSISGDPDLVEKGWVSVALGNASIEDSLGKRKIIPRIILHLSQLKKESQEISELLSLDSIIKIR